MVFNRNLDSAPREQNDDREDKKKKSPVKRPGADDLKKRKYKHRGGPPRKNALVEYWNSLPYGRKHRPTSRAYKMAAQFFRAMLKGQLFPGAVDEAFAHDCRISDELIYKQWTAAEIKQVLEKMNRLFHPAYDSSRLPKDLNNLLLHEEYGTSRFLMVAQHGLPNRRKPGKKITKLVELTNDIAKAIVDNGGLMSNSLMGRLNYNLIQLNKHYEKNVLPGTPDWARHIISPYSRFLNEYLKFIGRTYNKDVIINPGWFKPDCIPYRRFLKWIDHESGANTNLSGTRGRWE